MPLQNFLTKDKFAELLTQFAHRWQICWIAVTIYLGNTKFSEFLTEFADIMNLLINLLTMDILAGSDTSTTLLKFLHHAHLSTAGAEWSDTEYATALLKYCMTVLTTWKSQYCDVMDNVISLDSTGIRTKCQSQTISSSGGCGTMA